MDIINVCISVMHSDPSTRNAVTRTAVMMGPALVRQNGTGAELELTIARATALIILIEPILMDIICFPDEKIKIITWLIGQQGQFVVDLPLVCLQRYRF